MGVLCTWVKLLTHLQILGCELHTNAFGGRLDPDPHRHFLKQTSCILFEYRDKSTLPLISTHYVISCPQNGDRILTIDTVTSLHPMYTELETDVG